MRGVARNVRMNRGDTIIEVVFAVVVFSFVAISSLTIMNKGVAAGEKALEITLVRQQVNAQAEALRYIHEARVVTPESELAKTWDELLSVYGQEKASEYGVSGGDCMLPGGSTYNPFVLNARTAKVWDNLTMEYEGSESLPPYSQVVYNDDDPTVIDAAYGIWVEAVPSSHDADYRQFVDFHIRACWPAPGSDMPMTVGTIVRLYDPS